MERFFESLGAFVENRRRIIIIVGLILIVAALFGAMRLTIATGADTWVSQDSQVYKDFERFNSHFSSDVIVVMVTGDDLSQLLQSENLKAMATVESQMAANPNVVSATGPTFFMAMIATRQSGTPALPNDPRAIQAMVVDPQTGKIRSELAGVFPDAKHALIPIVIRGGLPQDEKKGLVHQTQSAVDTAGFVGVQPVVTGAVALIGQVSDLIASAMRTMLIIAIILMLVILGLIFRVRGFFAWRWLALGMVGIGIIYTFGGMGLMGVPITMVSMAVFPVLIGIGIDYSINLHNRYDEEIRRGESPSRVVINSVTHMGPALCIALFSECAGFAAILFSPIPMIRAFGLMLIVGVIICFAGAISFTLPILYWRDTRAGKRAAGNETEYKPPDEGADLLDKGLGRLAPWVIKNPAVIIPLGLALAVVGFVYNFNIQTEQNWTNLLSQNIALVQSSQTLDDISGGSGTSMLIEANDVTDPEVLRWMVQFEAFVSSQQEIVDASANSIADLVLQANGGEMPKTSEETKQLLANLPAPLISNLISADYKAANIPIRMSSPDLSKREQMSTELADYAKDHPVGSYLAATGEGAIQNAFVNGLNAGRMEITLIGIGMVFFALLLVFRFSLTKTILSWLPLVLVVGWVAGVMYLTGIKYNPLTISLGAMIMGMGVEYTILYMMRYYEERGKGEAPATAMTTAMTRVGRAITASGVTTIGGFTALLASGGFLLVRDFGFVTMLAVFFGLVSALVVHPPMVVLVDSWLERRRQAQVLGTIGVGIMQRQTVPEESPEWREIMEALRIKKGRIQEGVFSWTSSNMARYPWRHVGSTPYEVIIGEILMEGSTYAVASQAYRRFLRHFPSFSALAEANEDALARALDCSYFKRHRTSIKSVIQDFLKQGIGEVPKGSYALRAPGLKAHNVNAIMCFGYGLHLPVIDSNVSRMLSRLFHNSIPSEESRELIQAMGEILLPDCNDAQYNASLLELAGQICRFARPLCAQCSLMEVCDHACAFVNVTSIQAEG
jgi:hydrophobe/amphiphile efflux-3 (HAE3) family protein